MTNKEKQHPVRTAVGNKVLSMKLHIADTGFRSLPFRTHGQNRHIRFQHKILRQFLILRHPVMDRLLCTFCNAAHIINFLLCNRRT